MPTLSTTLLLQAILAAYRTRFPMLGYMGTDFSDKPLRLGDTVIAHVRKLPTSSNYDTVTGYANGATEGRDLLVDLPITVDKHRHVPLKWSHLWLIKDQKNTYRDTITDTAFVLGREMIQSILAKCNSANVSREYVETEANTDLDTIENLRTLMNASGASASGRVGIITSAAAQALGLDSRVASKDYYGNVNGGGGAYRVFRGLAGFDAIYEFPDLGTNNAASGTFTAATTDIITKTAHGFGNGAKVRLTNSGGALPAGLSAGTTYYVRDVTTDTFKVSTTRGGTAVDITDTGTGTHSVVGYENLTGIFFEASGIAVRAGIPEQTAEAAAALGITQTMTMETLKDEESHFLMALMKWQQQGTGDLYVSPTTIWGSSVGCQGGAAGAITDNAIIRLVKA